MKRWMLALIMLSLLCTTVFAHPGRTDGKGGHHNRSTGEYHYHHGYPEHQHTNGECPYDFDDRTGEDSGTKGSGGHEPASDSGKAEIKAKELPLALKVVAILFGGYYVLGLIQVVLAIGWGILVAIYKALFRRR